MQISEDLAEFYGIMIGDGCLSYVPAYKGTGPKYVVYIAGDSRNDFEFFTHIVLLINRLFGINVRIEKRADCNGILIRFSSKRVFELLRSFGFPVGKKRGIMIPADFSRNQLWSYVTRGIFDTDGCVVFSKQHKKLHYYPRIEITNSSKKLIDQLHLLLTQAGFVCSQRKTGVNCLKLEIAGVKNIEKWMQTIGSNNQKHVRKYLIWQKLGYYPLAAGVAQQVEEWA